MIIITYVSSHSSRSFNRLHEGDTQQEMDQIVKVFSSDYGEVSRTLIPKFQAIEYLYNLFRNLLGGIYHIETEEEVITSFKVVEVVSTGEEVYVVGEDEEGFKRHIAASEIRFYWSKK